MKDDIQLRRMVGLSLRHGFGRDGSIRGEVRDSDVDFGYADGCCAGGI